jgi:hypothetical protein
LTGWASIIAGETPDFAASALILDFRFNLINKTPRLAEMKI